MRVNEIRHLGQYPIPTDSICQCGPTYSGPATGNPTFWVIKADVTGKIRPTGAPRTPRKPRYRGEDPSDGQGTPRPPCHGNGTPPPRPSPCHGDGTPGPRPPRLPAMPAPLPWPPCPPAPHAHAHALPPCPPDPHALAPLAHGSARTVDPRPPCPQRRGPGRAPCPHTPGRYPPCLAAPHAHGPNGSAPTPCPPAHGPSPEGRPLASAEIAPPSGPAPSGPVAHAARLAHGPRDRHALPAPRPWFRLPA